MKQLIIMVPETEEERKNHSVIHGMAKMTGELNDDGKDLIQIALEVMNYAFFTNSDKHGWYEEYWRGDWEKPRDSLGQRNFGEVISLITSELSEALEAFRDGDDQTVISYDLDKGGKPEGIASELADAIIRICDYAGAYNVPLGRAIVEKHAYNLTRPYRHGGKKA